MLRVRERVRQTPARRRLPRHHARALGRPSRAESRSDRRARRRASLSREKRGRLRHGSTRVDVRRRPDAAARRRRRIGE